jgi:hypothetical protein
MRHFWICLALACSVLAFGASSAAAATTINPAYAPSGTHLQSGTIGCTVNADLSVSCSGFELAGVGNTNAVASLTASYSGTIDCRNHGGNVVESHTATFSDTDTVQLTSSRNGRLRVTERSVSAGGAPQVCPNPNWTPEIRRGTLVLNSYTYTLTFAGFSSPYITITGP